MYCDLCFKDHLSQLIRSDDLAVASGTMLQRRSDDVLHALCKCNYIRATGSAVPVGG